MSYITIKPSTDEEYKLRLTMQGVMTLENTFNKTLYTIISEVANGGASFEIIIQILKESFRTYGYVDTDKDIEIIMNRLVYQYNYGMQGIYDIITRVFEHAGYFNFSNNEVVDNYDNENNTYPEEEVEQPDSMDKCLIYSPKYLLPRAIECGMEESKFWNSTLGEVQRYIEAYNKKYTDNYKRDLVLCHLTADLVCYSVGRLLSEDAKYPDIYDMYPTLFGEEIEQREIIREQQEKDMIKTNLMNLFKNCVPKTAEEMANKKKSDRIENTSLDQTTIQEGEQD